MVSQRTVYHDDAAGCTPDGFGANCRYTESEWADWDHYGHYRRTTAASNFGEGNRITETSWNKVGGVQRVIATNQKWILNTYEDARVIEVSAGGGRTSMRSPTLPPDF